MSRSTAISVVKFAFVTVARGAIVGWLTAVFPFLANPFLAMTIRHFVDDFLTFLTDVAETKAFFEYIDFRTSEQGRKFFASAEENYLAHQSGDAERVKRAEHNLKVDFKNFVKFTS
jgi:hypothetical protein